MEQNNQAQPSALSNASMLAALGITLMYGLTVLLSLTVHNHGDSYALWVLPPVCLILWLIGMYNLSSVFKNANTDVARRFKGIFNGQLGIVITTVVCVLLFVLVVNKAKRFSDIDTFVLNIRMLLVALCVCHVVFLTICYRHSRALKSAGLKSMGLVSAAFVLQLVVMSILAIFFFVVLFMTEKVFTHMIGHGIDGIYVLGVILGLTLIVAALIMIIGWWGVRNELPKVYDGAFKRVGEL